MTTNADLSRDECLELAAKGFRNPRFFCKFFLTDWFGGPMSWVHVGILAILTRQTDFLREFDEEYTQRDLDKILKHFTYRSDPADERSKMLPIFVADGNSLSLALSRYTLIMMPRGTSKTTLLNAVSIYNTEYLIHKMYLYLSEAGSHAEAQITSVGRMLVNNPRLRAVFGDLRPEQRNLEGLRWSESEGIIQTTSGVTFLARGRGAQIRGTIIGGHRPDMIVFDDIEDKDSVRTGAQRTKAAEWFFGDVVPALSQLNPKAAIVGVGTMLGSEALLAKLEKDPEWTTVKFAVEDADGDPIWPQWMDKEKIEAKRQSYATKNLLHIFYLEYFNTIRAQVGSAFSVFAVAPAPLDEYVFRAMAIDPAISAARRADSAVVVVVGMKENGIIGVLDAWGKRGASPREQIDQYFRLHFLYMPQRHGVETIAWQAALQHLLMEEMFRKAAECKRNGRNPADAYFDITPITHSSKKEERIEGILQPRYAAGYIVHQKVFPELETQLRDWPHGKRDWPDALAMAVSLLDDVAPMAGAGEATKELEPLDEIMGGNWRSY